jgi:hypothetical protein
VFFGVHRWQGSFDACCKELVMEHRLSALS